MNHPTPTEIALIAATLARGKDPGDFIQSAIKLHSDCARALDPERQTPTPAPRMSLDDVLEACSEADQNRGRLRKKFFEFLGARVINDPKFARTLSEPTLTRVTQDNWEVMRKDGVPFMVAMGYVREFLKWNRERVSQAKAAGGYAKAAKKQR